MAVTGLRLERLLDVNPQEALPHRDVSTEPAHLPGTRLKFTSLDEIKLLRHLFEVRTHPERFEETDVELTTDAWRAIALDHGRLLYDCHVCRVTWPIRDSDATCLVGHPIPED